MIVFLKSSECPLSWFYRAEKSRSTRGHFGLGLSIAYEIVASHNGSITVKDAVPKGAEFVVVLPEK